MNSSNTDPIGVKPIDPDIAEQAVPGHGVPSQDPDSAAQVALNPEEAARESKSVLIGGGMVVGLAAGAAAGAAVAGPVGILAGATVGAVVGVVGSGAVGAAVGGLVGKAAAEKIDPTREDAYWRENFKTRPYVDDATRYEDYGPAYGLGVEAQARYPGRSFNDVEGDLSRDWNTSRGGSSLDWSRAQHATRDAWDRVAESGQRSI